MRIQLGTNRRWQRDEPWDEHGDETEAAGGAGAGGARAEGGARDNDTLGMACFLQLRGAHWLLRQLVVSSLSVERQ